MWYSTIPPVCKCYQGCKRSARALSHYVISRGSAFNHTFNPIVTSSSDCEINELCFFLTAFARFSVLNLLLRDQERREMMAAFAARWDPCAKSYWFSAEGLCISSHASLFGILLPWCAERFVVAESATDKEKLCVLRTASTAKNF